MEFLCQLWQKILSFWQQLWGVPEIEMQLYNPREPIDDELNRLTKIIYYHKSPKLCS